MSKRTLYQKLVDSHVVTRIDEQNVLLYVDLHLMNEYTSPQAFSALAAKARPRASSAAATGGGQPHHSDACGIAACDSRCRVAVAGE